MSWNDVQIALLGEWASIAGPKLYTAFALALVIVGGWILLTWRDSAIIQSLRARLRRAEERNRSLERELPGMTPAEAAARLRRLQEQVAALPPRRLSDEQRQAISAAGGPPPAAPHIIIVHDKAHEEARRYARDFIEAFTATPGWNVIDEAYPITAHTTARGLGVGLLDAGDPTPTEMLVMTALTAAGVEHDIVPRINEGAHAELVITSR